MAANCLLLFLKPEVRFEPALTSRHALRKLGNKQLWLPTRDNTAALTLRAHLSQNINVVIPSTGPALVYLDHAVHYRYVSALYVKHNHLAHADRALAHGQEQNVAAVIGWFHAAAQHHYHLHRGVTLIALLLRQRQHV